MNNPQRGRHRAVPRQRETHRQPLDEELMPKSLGRTELPVANVTGRSGELTSNTRSRRRRSRSTGRTHGDHTHRIRWDDIGRILKTCPTHGKLTVGLRGTVFCMNDCTIVHWRIQDRH